MAETTVIIHDYRVDGNTGRIEVHLKCRTVDGKASWDGPVKQYSVDPQALRDRFNGSVGEFEQWAMNEHASIVGAPPGLAEQLAKRKGTILGKV